MAQINKHRWSKLSGAIVAILSLCSFNAVALLATGTASANSVGGIYNYALDSSSGALYIMCQGEANQPTHECPDVKPTRGLTLVGHYYYVQGSAYTFRNPDTGAVITVNDARNPSAGSYQYSGFDNNKAYPVNVVMPEVFTSYFTKGKTGDAIKLVANVNFGKTDSSLAIPANLGLTAKITPDSSVLGPEFVMNFAQDTPLDKNPVTFTQPVEGLKAGTSYQICINSDYTKGSNGKIGSSVCKSITAQSTTQTLTFNLTGDPSILKTFSCDNGNTAAWCQNNNGPTNVKDPALNAGNCSDVSKCDLINKYINPFVNLLAALVGIAVVVSIIIGGIQYSSSAGDPAKVSAAKNRIRNAIIALVTFLFLYALLNFLIPGGLL